MNPPPPHASPRTGLQPPAELRPIRARKGGVREDEGSARQEICRRRQRFRKIGLADKREVTNSCGLLNEQSSVHPPRPVSPCNRSHHCRMTEPDMRRK